MSYQTQRYAAIAIAALLAVLGVVMAGQPSDYGLGPVQYHWLTAVTAGLGVIMAFLPRIQLAERRPTDAGPPTQTDQPPA